MSHGLQFPPPPRFGDEDFRGHTRNVCRPAALYDARMQLPGMPAGNRAEAAA